MFPKVGCCEIPIAVCCWSTRNGPCGDAIAVRANVVDEQFEPLRNPNLEADLIAPDGRSQKLSLQRVDGELEGIFAGRFVASQEGEYRVELPLPGVGEPIVLQREVRVRLPNLEIERPQRNDAVLQNLAD